MERISKMHISDIYNNFEYHPPLNEDTVKTYKAIRDEAKKLALYLNEVCPDSRELEQAFINIEQVVMWANAAIARHGLVVPDYRK